MTISAKVIEDSINEAGNRLTTLQLLYPRFIHSELMTHRVFSRNASSSRAIPVKKMLEMVRNDPAMPIHWGKNQAGMQASEECFAMVENLQLFGTKVNADVGPKEAWIEAASRAADVAEKMMDAGYHKQVVNRLLEPFQHISVVLTATEFDNWFELRAHADAQPEIQLLAVRMLAAMGENVGKTKLLKTGEWHLPYVTQDERNDQFFKIPGNEGLLRKISAARCCRVSYLKHDGSASSVEEDLSLCDRLAAARPIHASPFEHQATPMPDVEPRVYFNGNGDVDAGGQVPEGVSHIDMDGYAWSGNFKGWIQSRKLIEANFQ